ncbi:MAG TPA: thermonuclease family protein [Cyclobacteriaceae bacterium]|nr:thermonuclease family protein [Cyclobacteriaceae bacterium]HRJ81267.1 thermonuclease family protein [Cyclobacteriaceae bacterium]
MKIFGAIVMMLLIGWNAVANTVKGKVVSVVDGNTLEIVSEDNETYKVVLAGIDSPELEQEFGEAAKEFLEKFINDKAIQVQLQGKDRWGNYVGVVYINKGTDLRKALLSNGFAWVVEKEATEEFKKLEQKAREQGTGLWKAESPTPPWVFRRQQTMIQPKAG